MKKLIIAFCAALLVVAVRAADTAVETVPPRPKVVRSAPNKVELPVTRAEFNALKAEVAQLKAASRRPTVAVPPARTARTNQVAVPRKPPVSPP